MSVYTVTIYGGMIVAAIMLFLICTAVVSGIREASQGRGNGGHQPKPCGFNLEDAILPPAGTAAVKQQRNPPNIEVAVYEYELDRLRRQVMARDIKDFDAAVRFAALHSQQPEGDWHPLPLDELKRRLRDGGDDAE